MDNTRTIRHSRTEAGERVITLNADAMAAILEFRERSKGFFGDSLSADWYLFPSGDGQGPKINKNLDAISTPAPSGDFQAEQKTALFTKSDTKAESDGMVGPEVIENAGGDDGTRTRGLMRDRHAF